MVLNWPLRKLAKLKNLKSGPIFLIMHPNVDNVIILYHPGYAGNFILRLICLSPEVLPTMPKKTLLDWSASTVKPELTIPAMYSYDTVSADHSNDWLAFHDAWAGIYEYSVYDSIIDLGTTYKKIAYQVHPFEYAKFEDLIVSAKSKTLMYVDLDLTKYGSWVDREISRIKCYPRGDELTQGLEFQKKYSMYKINLTSMLDSIDGFITEYTALTEHLAISKKQEFALELYQNWRKYRVDNA